MPIHHIHNMLMISPDFSHKEKYWKILTFYVKNEYGNEEIKEPNLVQQILKECFSLWNEAFMHLIQGELRVSFYMFALNFHENSIKLWKKQIEGLPLGMDEGIFAITRRVLKVILEQSCGLNLVNAPHVGNEMYQNREEYRVLLEELLYLGYWSNSISEYIATSQLFPKSTGVTIVENEFKILTYELYTELLGFIYQDLPRHSPGVELHNSLIEFKPISQN